MRWPAGVSAVLHWLSAFPADHWFQLTVAGRSCSIWGISETWGPESNRPQRLVKPNSASWFTLCEVVVCWSEGFMTKRDDFFSEKGLHMYDVKPLSPKQFWLYHSSFFSFSACWLLCFWIQSFLGKGYQMILPLACAHYSRYSHHKKNLHQGYWAMKSFAPRNCYYQSAESIIEITRDEIKRCLSVRWVSSTHDALNASGICLERLLCVHKMVGLAYLSIQERELVLLGAIQNVYSLDLLGMWLFRCCRVISAEHKTMSDSPYCCPAVQLASWHNKALTPGSPLPC